MVVAMEEIKRRIILGTYVLSSGYYDAYYKKAQKVRTIIKDAYDELFEKYDVLLKISLNDKHFIVNIMNELYLNIELDNSLINNFLQ